MPVTAMFIAFVLSSVDSTAARTIAVWTDASPRQPDPAAVDRTAFDQAAVYQDAVYQAAVYQAAAAVLSSRVTAERAPQPASRATAAIRTRRPQLAAAGARLFAEISPPAGGTASEPSGERSAECGPTECEPNDDSVFRDPTEVLGR